MDFLASKLREIGLSDVAVKDGYEDHGANMKWTSLVSGNTWVINPAQWLDYMNGKKTADEIVEEIKADSFWSKKIVGDDSFPVPTEEDREQIRQEHAPDQEEMEQIEKEQAEREAHKNKINKGVEALNKITEWKDFVEFSKQFTQDELTEILNIFNKQKKGN